MREGVRDRWKGGWVREGKRREGKEKGDSARLFSDLEMTWILYSAGDATAIFLIIFLLSY